VVNIRLKKERNSVQSQAIVDMLLNQFGGSLVQQISQRLGVDEQTARRAISIGIPVLLAALARNTRSADGAQSLTGALERDHDGSILGQLGNLLNSPQLAQGSGILRHTLGAQRPQVEDSLTRVTGVQGSALLEMLAPLVMGQLGQLQRQNNLDADAVANVLGNEQQRLQRSPAGIGDLLSQILGAGGADVGGTRDSGTPDTGRRQPPGTSV